MTHRNPPWTSRRFVAIGATVIVLGVLAAYANCYRGTFVFDDWPTIKDNTKLAEWKNLREVLFPSTQHTTAGRPLANVSLVINYAISGLDVWSYHALNVLIHIGGALAVFGLVRRTFELPLLRERFGAVAPQLGFSVALLWALHPLQTESVTYIVQRTESLVAACYALTLYAFARAVLQPGEKRWPLLALGACYAGMLSKEVMVTAPLMALFYHRAFVTGSFRETWRQQWRLLLGMAAGWVLLGIALASTGGNRGGSVGLGVGVRFFDYWLTQPRALVYYLKLAVWPHPLVFEYGTEWITRASQVVPFALIVLPLIVLTVVGVVRWPRVSFAGAWFFGILAPTSLAPGVNQMIVEHRAYLPLAALIVLAVVGAHACFGRRTLYGVLAVALLFGGLTSRRNRDYTDVVTLWQDTVAKRPDNALAHRILADFLWQDENGAVRYERLPAALEQYKESLRLSPTSPTTHENYGAVLLLLGDLPGSIEHTLEALKRAPNHSLAHYNLGLAYAGLGRLADAKHEFVEALRLEPTYLDARKNLGNALNESGEPAAALPHYFAVLATKPNDPEALYNLGIALFRLGRYDEAAERFEATLKVTPDDADAHHNLGATLARLKRPAEATAHYERAAQLRLEAQRSPTRRPPTNIPKIERAR